MLTVSVLKKQIKRRKKGEKITVSRQKYKATKRICASGAAKQTDEKKATPENKNLRQLKKDSNKSCKNSHHL